VSVLFADHVWDARAEHERQIRDGLLQRGIESATSRSARPGQLAAKTCTAHMATLRVDMATSARSWVIEAKTV